MLINKLERIRHAFVRSAGGLLRHILRNSLKNDFSSALPAA